MLLEIWSGIQAGADISGLVTAYKYGIKTGGWATKGFRTEEGPKPELAAKFNIKEHESSNYHDRTVANIRDTDATLIIAGNFNSPGTKLTWKTCKDLKKPFLQIKVPKTPIVKLEYVSDNFYNADSCAQWIKSRNIEKLNVSGNRKSVCHNIEEFTKAYLSTVFDLLGFKQVHESLEHET